MEQIKNLLNIQAPNNGRTNDYAKSLQNIQDRKEALRKEIILLYQSNRKEIPASDILAVEVEIAMEDLAEIPTESLHGAFQAAKAEAGSFLASNGLIVKVYRGKEENAHQAALKAIRDENSAKYLHYKPEPPTAGEIEATAELLRKTREALDGHA